MSVTLHEGDLPDGLDLGDVIAIDTEAMGLKDRRDRLCVAQLSSGDGNAHLVRFAKGRYEAPNLKALLSDRNRLKLFHFARFDMALLSRHLHVMAAPVYCTKIASKIARTYTDKHSLRELCRELLSVDISKQQQSSDWGADALSQAQQAYAASDVLHLHEIRVRLDAMLAREGRTGLAQGTMGFLPHRVRLDLSGWDEDIFAHS